jgi:hypothetical protein
MDVGRVFFHYHPETTRLRLLEALTLDSHVDNVARLAEAWEPAQVYLRLTPEVDLTRTQDKLIEAAHRHDEAKPQCFRLTRDEAGRYSYSYRGHRFRVLVDDPYVAFLVRLHHEFSVDGVTEAVAALRDAGDLVGAANFPFDLYALEMCDQIAAEAESRAFGDEAREERVFMEFYLPASPDGQTFQIDPCPFSEPELRLTLTYFTCDPRGEEDPARLTQRLKAMPPDQEQTKEIVLCPLR